MAIPELEHHCGSWIIVSKATGAAVLETFERSTAERVNQQAYIVMTAARYLASLNRLLSLSPAQNPALYQHL